MDGPLSTQQYVALAALLKKRHQEIEQNAAGRDARQRAADRRASPLAILAATVTAPFHEQYALLGRELRSYSEWPLGFIGEAHYAHYPRSKEAEELALHNRVMKLRDALRVGKNEKGTAAFIKYLWEHPERRADIVPVLVTVREMLSGESSLGPFALMLQQHEAQEAPNSAKVDIRQIADAPRSYSGHAAEVAVEGIITRLTDTIVGRRDELTEIENFIEERLSGGNPGLLIITAPPGYGKSALAALWCRQQESVPSSHVARHFCQTSSPVTTDVERALAHLSVQVAAAFGETPDGSDALDQLVGRLGQDMPKGERLTVWLDGVDEASRPFSCFLPPALGRGVCVIMSARAHGDAVPVHLEPFAEWPPNGNQPTCRMCLSGFSKQDVFDLAVEKHSKAALRPPTMKLCKAVLKASSDGLPLLISLLIDDIVSKRQTNAQPEELLLPATVGEYARNCLQKLRQNPNWDKYDLFFSLMSIVKEPVTRIFCNDVMGGVNRVASFSSIPTDLMRWMRIVENVSGRGAVISFSHPALQGAFAHSLGGEIFDITAMLLKALGTRSEYDTYRARHLPAHVLDFGGFILFKEFLEDLDWRKERIDILGPPEAFFRLKCEALHLFTISRYGLLEGLTRGRCMEVLENIIQEEIETTGVFTTGPSGEHIVA